MGIAPFIAWYNYPCVEDRRAAIRERCARFWTKIFAVNFAIGVVTGIPMEFQFGTNWAAFSAKTGAVIGQPLMMEGVYAFFLESVFLGVLLYGRGRVSPASIPRLPLSCGSALGLSGFFIVVRDRRVDAASRRIHDRADGRIELQSLAPCCFSPFAGWQFAHVQLCGAVVAGGFIVAGVGAYYLLGEARHRIRTRVRACGRHRRA
jgi:cytochrome d ubiquinol oxidase subunit I